MRFRIILILILIGVFCFDGKAQSNLKIVKIPTNLIVELDSNSVQQSSIKVFPDLKYTFKNNKISFEKTNEDSVVVSFRTFPFSFTKEFKKYDISQKDTIIEFKAPNFTDIETREELFSSPNIEKSGVLSRGISFGNKQDVFVNSNLNLQMQGELSDGIVLNAVISDQNIPFQPEGNTQQIQEFDRIFINLDHKHWGLSAGDVLLQKEDAFYMKYFKKVQGAKFEVKTGNDTVSSKTFVAAAVAKGKFNSMLVSQIEGVQGPYRLQGINGEQFIVVISNSEKVFLDGQKLKRGFDFDYTIDYNTAEIIFTNGIVITKFSRIRVDFEYTERNYSRAVYAFGHQQSNKKLDVSFDYFNEKDNKRQPVNTTFSAAEELILASIGDSLQNAVVQSEDTFKVGNEDRILYAKKDTTGITIFEFSSSSNKDSLFTVVFSEVAVGLGDYTKELNTINGRVFKWIGKGNGTFLPVRILPAPNKRQMIGVSIDYKLNKRTKITSEFAMSEKDINLFSEIDDEDNKGFAMKIKVTNEQLELNRKLFLKSSFEYQLQDEKFNVLDRIRNVDFERDWNSNSIEKATENILNAKFNMIDTSGNSWNYALSFRNKKELINGFQHTIDFDNKILSFFKIKGKAFIMDNQNTTQKTQWRRFFINPELNINDKSKVGYEFNFDKNKIIQKDSILRPLMNYDEQVFYIKSGDSINGSLIIEHRLRKDYLPVLNQLDFFNKNWNDRSNTSTITYGGKIGDNNDFKVTSTYRILHTKDTTTALQNEQNILGRFDWNSKMLSKHISSNLTYTINSAREQVKEVQYIPVLQSQGTHVWIDFNKDGIKDLDEFQQIVEEVNVGTDTLYAKFLFPTSEYIPAFTHNLNYRLNVKAPKNWRKKKGLRNFIARMDNVTYLVIDKKTTDENFNSRLNPFSSSLEFDRDNADVLSLTRNFRSTLFFNKTNPKYALDLTRVVQGGKQLLNNGQDGRFLKEWKLNTRFFVMKKVTLKIKGIESNKESKSTFLSSREYVVKTNQLSNLLAYQPSKSVRISIGYDLKLKNGIADTVKPTALTNEFLAEIKIRQLSKRTITSSFKYVNINFKNGDERTPVAYEMLEALQSGNNFLWKFNLQQRLSNGLNITLIYEGRKSSLSPAVHTGSMQVSALF